MIYKENHDRVTSRPYRLVRHPIYTGIMLMLIGVMIYSGSIIIAAIFIGMSVMFMLRIGKEEDIMIRLFNKRYKDYMKGTKRLIP